jgi:hypothetical protein
VAKKIEEILGVPPFSGERIVPGMISVEGREYWYVQDNGKDDIDHQFHEVITAIEPPLHAKGGALTGGCELTLPDGRKFHAFSYKGDLDGWRKQIANGAEKLGLAAARVVDGNLIFSDGNVVPLLEGKPRFY